MSATVIRRQTSSRPGHLDTAWEVAVISSCVIIFLAASIAIYKVRRRESLRKTKKHSRKRPKDSEPTEKVEVDNQKDVEHTGHSDQDDEEYTDDEDDVGQSDCTKSKTDSRSKAAQHSRSDSQRSGTEISHSSQLPPTHQGNHR